MSSKSTIPDYELADQIVITAPEQLRAIADPLRDTILDLLLERAATVTELAAAVKRPKSTVAHHVNVLVAAGGGAARMPRTGDPVSGSAAGLSPTDSPTLPAPKDEPAGGPAKRKPRSAKRKPRSAKR